MTDTAALVLRNFHGSPEITARALQLKAEALDAARSVTRVETSEQQVVALEALRLVKDVRTELEASRKMIKKPVLDLGREIDNIAAKFGAEIEKAFGRLSGLINHYQRKQVEKQNEVKNVVESNVALAHELRQRAEDARTAGHEAEANSLSDQAFELEMQSEIATVPVNDKPKGLVVRSKINFRVTDAIVFCQAYPHYWRVGKNGDHENEAMTVDRMRVLDELNREGGGEFHATRFPEELSQIEDRRLVQPAGLRVYEETKAHLR